MKNNLSDLNAKVEKLKIHVYKTSKRTAGEKINTVEVMFNPQQYSQNYENNFSEAQGLNTASSEPAYVNTASEDLSLEFVIDGTNVYPETTKSGITVKERVEQFIKLTAKMDGDIHQPPFLKIEWGDLIFDCRLRSVNIVYSLFSGDGKALRAKLNTVFISDISYEKQNHIVKKSSPDLSHNRVVVGGDSLPIMAHKIYGDPALYLRLAKINNLDNFRAIKPGTDIKFLPLIN